MVIHFSESCQMGFLKMPYCGLKLKKETPTTALTIHFTVNPSWLLRVG